MKDNFELLRALSLILRHFAPNLTWNFSLKKYGKNQQINKPMNNFLGKMLCFLWLIVNKIWILCFCSGAIKIVHPVHLHRHHFQVLKIAYPLFDPETGNSTAFNPDIRSLNEQCTKATWADPSWINGNNPGVNLVNPPLKDVVNVPAIGYFIIRFMADNSGIQFYNRFLKIIFYFFWLVLFIL